MLEEGSGAQTCFRLDSGLIAACEALGGGDTHRRGLHLGKAC